MIGLVIPSNIWFSPFVSIYTKVLDQLNADYTIISWNRDGKDKEIGIQFDLISGYEKRNDYISYWRYAIFIKKVIRENNIDKLIVFTPQLAILLSRFLKKNFKGKYIFDYRDLSVEQKPIFKVPFKSVLANSFANFISSPGFEPYLPKGFDYNISHNFNIDALRGALAADAPTPRIGNPIEVLTIGGIRDYESNIEVVKALANKEGVHLSFVGRGIAAAPLEQYSASHGISNISFKGFYQKEDEPVYIENASFLNIFYPRKRSHDTALSNRFYNSLIFRKPMIVTKDTTQGDYCDKYDLGLAIENCDHLDQKLKSFATDCDMQAYAQRCDTLLREFLKDYDKFVSILKDFISA